MGKNDRRPRLLMNEQNMYHLILMRQILVILFLCILEFSYIIDSHKNMSFLRAEFVFLYSLLKT